MPLPRLSVTIITKNEAHRIERCLRSVAFADEIVVVDSGSTDATVDIARRLGARVLVTDWPGFGVQKNRALDLARGDWVLSLDADEVVGDDLRAEIVRVVGTGGDTGTAAAIDATASDRVTAITTGGPDGYWITRSSSFCGQTIRHGDWRNDRVLRLFRRCRARFTEDAVHERVECPGPQARLGGVLLHDSVDSLEDAVEKTERYARLGAERLRAGGRGGLVPALAHAAWTFLRGYLIRLGVLDGRAGLTIAALNARGTFLKYRLAGRRPAPTLPGEPR
ncbi:MAG TPA: glycosyltransferase family 2 protein [Quisquiliibacterium sp.]|nr:glycosyltransferase family 2 protein [Quisquiliibacterium sp.]